ncbi:MAG: DUF1732 domain-containing protein [Bdellovibrionota bacterium]
MSVPRWASMTGYAQADIGLKGRHFKFQIKSVNHRFFEFRIRAPREWQMLENEFRSWCKEELQRGSVDFSIEEARGAFAARGTSSEDFSKARGFICRLTQALEATQGDWGNSQISDGERARILSNHPETWNSDFNVKEVEVLPEADELKSFVMDLCGKLLEQRLSEGEETRRSVIEHGSYIRSQWELIRNELPPLKEAWRKGLEERLQKLAESFSGGSLESGRIYQEFVLLADKRDVSEEVQRIDSHLKALDALIESPKDPAIGKRLDFIAQELNREWTTLSNKIQDAALNQHVGEAKLTIEKIREQSLNLV